MSLSPSQSVSLSFYRFAGLRARAWAFTQMGFARPGMANTPDIGFWKLCGSGKGEGFTPTASPAVYAILATWPDEMIARTRVETAPVYTRFRERATEAWSVFLTPFSAKGQWSGIAPFAPVGQSTGGPIAALTRATVKPSIATRFWGRVPNISAMIGKDPNVAFKIGIGEVPLFQQVTFSIWPSEQAMAAFARTGPHAEAIRAVRTEGWFREELYARFAVSSDMGHWDGGSPLDKLKEAA